MSFYGLIGAIAFLILGVFELAMLQRTLYPALRQRYEQAKLTQQQGTEPGRIMILLRIQSLLMMPLLGFLLGKALTR